MEETGAPSMRAKQMRSPCESAMATAAAFCICESLFHDEIDNSPGFSIIDVGRVLIDGRIQPASSGGNAG